MQRNIRKRINLKTEPVIVWTTEKDNFDQLRNICGNCKESFRLINRIRKNVHRIASISHTFCEIMLGSVQLQIDFIYNQKYNILRYILLVNYSEFYFQILVTKSV